MNQDTSPDAPALYTAPVALNGHVVIPPLRTVERPALDPLHSKRPGPGFEETPDPVATASLDPTPESEGASEVHAFVGRFSSPENYQFPTPIVADPKLDLAFLHAEALAGGAGAEGRVKEHHLDIHEMARGGELGVLEELEVQFRGRQKQVDGYLTRVRAALAAVPQYLDVPIKEGRKPWTFVAGLAVVGTLAGGLALLFTDAHACATTLQESGLATFATKPWRAWAMSSSPVILSAVSKTFLHFISNRKVRNSAAKTIAILAIGAALAWSYLFAMTFPGLATPVNEMLGSLFKGAAQDHAAVPAMASQWLVLLQIIAGGLGSAAMFEQAYLIYDGRQSAKREETSQFAATRKDLEDLEKLARKEAEHRGRIKGRLKALKAERAALCRNAVSRYGALRELAQRDSARLEKLLHS